MLDSRNWLKPTPQTRTRRLRQSSHAGIRICIDGQTGIDFASNDYLGLSQHPELIAQAQASIAQGLGSTASRYISGDHPSMHQLEAALAHWKNYEDALMVGSGMLANTGLIQALATRHSQVFCDKQNHASLIDGVRLSGARCHRYEHQNMQQLRKLLQQYPGQRRLIISDGVFSMDGDSCQTEQLLAFAEDFQTLLIIDDAHGTGVLGAQGRGCCADIANHPRLIETGTFGKAMGGYGAYILGTSELIAGLRQNMRTAIYSTALPPCIPAAMCLAIKHLQAGKQQQQLQANINYFLDQAKAFKLPLLASTTAIQALILGSDERAVKAEQQLWQQGFFVAAIRPPTVKVGSSRLRITLSAAHTQKDIKALLQACAACI